MSNTSMNSHAPLTFDPAEEKKKLRKCITKLIEENNIALLYKFRNVLDTVHKTGKTVRVTIQKEPIVVSPETLPPDEDFELMESILSKHTEIITQNPESAETPMLANADLSELWMGTLPKPNELKIENQKILIMPKLDGISCGIKFVRNADNDIVIYKAITRQNVDITNKVKHLFTVSTQNILTNLNRFYGANPEQIVTKQQVRALQAPEKQTPGQTETTQSTTEKQKTEKSDVVITPSIDKFRGFKSLNVRGELVIRNKSLTQSAPAAYISGKINGGMEVFEAAAQTIVFVPYEIMRYQNMEDNIERPTQFESLKFFNSIKSLMFKTKSTMLKSVGDYVLNDLFQPIFTTIKTELPFPLDGVVYCSPEWQYPFTKSDTLPSVYGKYAWKPSSEAHANIVSFGYNINRASAIGLEITYTPFILNDKTYKRSKTSISQIITLMNIPTEAIPKNVTVAALNEMITSPGIGIGCNALIKLAGDISPYLLDYEMPVDKSSYTQFKLPEQCPFCKSPTKISITKTATTLKCTNSTCSGIMIQCYKNFLQKLKIAGIAEGKLLKLTNPPNELNIKSIQKAYKPDIIDIIKNSQTSLFLQALGIAGGDKALQTCLTKMKADPTNGVVAANLSKNILLSVAQNLDDIHSIWGSSKDALIHDVLHSL